MLLFCCRFFIIATVITDANGIARFDKHTETIAPKGSILNERRSNLKLKKDGQIVKHAVENHKEETNTAAPPAKKDRDIGHVKKNRRQPAAEYRK